MWQLWKRGWCGPIHHRRLNPREGGSRWARFEAVHPWFPQMSSIRDNTAYLNTKSRLSVINYLTWLLSPYLHHAPFFLTSLEVVASLLHLYYDLTDTQVYGAQILWSINMCFDINTQKKVTSVTTHSQCVTDALIYSCFSAALSLRLVRCCWYSPCVPPCWHCFPPNPIDSGALSDRWL